MATLTHRSAFFCSSAARTAGNPASFSLSLSSGFPQIKDGEKVKVYLSQVSLPYSGPYCTKGTFSYCANFAATTPTFVPCQLPLGMPTAADITNFFAVNVGLQCNYDNPSGRFYFVSSATNPFAIQFTSQDAATMLGFAQGTTYSSATTTEPFNGIASTPSAPLQMLGSTVQPKLGTSLVQIRSSACNETFALEANGEGNSNIVVSMPVVVPPRGMLSYSDITGVNGVFTQNEAYDNFTVMLTDETGAAWPQDAEWFFTLVMEVYRDLAQEQSNILRATSEHTKDVAELTRLNLIGRSLKRARLD